VERGSLLSHSAVVARELGIPTVVAVSGVMSDLQDGDQVRVDATSGQIILLERPE
jgi:pyruvate,water dikinase